MKVLSLFDGMSCGRIALDRAGIKVSKYYASEIDKYAQIVSEKNYPDIVRLGDITRWKQWTYSIENPDIIIAGSPCQGFSFAGKQLNFNDPRSALFFTFVDILEYYKPEYFLLENVKMKKEYQDVISKRLGVEPIEINSALVSAQNRKRLYWTNIPGVTQPDDKGLVLRDVLEEGWKSRVGRDISVYSQKDTGKYIQFDINNRGNGSQDQRAYKTGSKCGTLSKAHSSRVKFYHDGKSVFTTLKEEERLQTVPDDYTAGVAEIQRHHMLGNGWTVDIIAHIFKGLTK